MKYSIEKISYNKLNASKEPIVLEEGVKIPIVGDSINDVINDLDEIRGYLLFLYSGSIIDKPRVSVESEYDEQDSYIVVSWKRRETEDEVNERLQNLKLYTSTRLIGIKESISQLLSFDPECKNKILEMINEI